MLVIRYSNQITGTRTTLTQPNTSTLYDQWSSRKHFTGEGENEIAWQTAARERVLEEADWSKMGTNYYSPSGYGRFGVELLGWPKTDMVCTYGLETFLISSLVGI